MATTISKKRKFVGDGVFKAELNEFLTRELSEDGYSGVEVRVTPTRTEIIIMATRTDRVLGEKNRRIKELTSVVQKRFNFPENSVVLYGEKVANRGLCAIAQAESLRFKLIGGLAVRRACYGVLRYIMECGAKGELKAHVKVVKQNLLTFFSCRLRGGRLWKAAWSTCQVHEVRGRFNDPLWRSLQRLRRHSDQTRLVTSRSAWNQSENHVTVGRERKIGSQETAA